MDDFNSQTFASGYFSHSQIIKITAFWALISSPAIKEHYISLHSLQTCPSESLRTVFVSLPTPQLAFCLNTRSVGGLCWPPPLDAQILKSQKFEFVINSLILGTGSSIPMVFWMYWGTLVPRLFTTYLFSRQAKGKESDESANYSKWGLGGERRGPNEEWRDYRRLWKKVALFFTRPIPYSVKSPVWRRRRYSVRAFNDQIKIREKRKLWTVYLVSFLMRRFIWTISFLKNLHNISRF